VTVTVPSSCPSWVPLESAGRLTSTYLCWSPAEAWGSLVKRNVGASGVHAVNERAFSTEARTCSAVGRRWRAESLDVVSSEGVAQPTRRAIDVDVTKRRKEAMLVGGTR